MIKEFFNPSNYDMPLPSRLLILDDLSMGDPVLTAYTQVLASLIDSKNKSMLADTERLAVRLKNKYRRMLALGEIKSIDLAVGVGKAGKEIAALLDLSVPIIQINPTRKVKEDGMPEIISKTGTPLDEEIKQEFTKFSIDMAGIESIGIVDDVIFFGGTIQAAQSATASTFPNIPYTAFTLAYARPFATEYVTIPVVSAVTLTTIQEKQNGINVIDARDFIAQDALPLQNGRSIPFMDEENWMRTWFGKNYERAYVICRELKRLKGQKL